MRVECWCVLLLAKLRTTAGGCSVRVARAAVGRCGVLLLWLRDALTTRPRRAHDAPHPRASAAYSRIEALETNIERLKADIRTRDETIGEKEKKIYDLKKKNQELEKFKFVLDYKIKELKRQIEPRENEITDMKEQIKEMDRELEQHVHSLSRALTLSLSNSLTSRLALRRRGSQHDFRRERPTATHAATPALSNARPRRRSRSRDLFAPTRVGTTSPTPRST